MSTTTAGPTLQVHFHEDMLDLSQVASHRLRDHAAGLINCYSPHHDVRIRDSGRHHYSTLYSGGENRLSGRKLVRRLLGYFWVYYNEDPYAEIDVVYRRMTHGR
ncbi:hypothetical protein RB195_015368 [Necator americanus]|uniref:Uncharacterized protein n=1 Tax=Necator americanus TaxID=51031 RepID=A0ABR1E483_NECAM